MNVLSYMIKGTLQIIKLRVLCVWGEIILDSLDGPDLS